ncbi:MAG: hypothetical protein ACE5IQ_03660 [Candidatus Methylomirabilales bacterium]
MKIWYEIIILAFISLYGSLSLALLGHWAYHTVRGQRRPVGPRSGGWTGRQRPR